MLECRAGRDRMEFLGAAARVTDEKQRGVRVARMAASDVGIEALDLVRETLLLQEIQRPVNRRRLRRAFAIEPIQEIVGLCWPFSIKKQFEHLAADAGQFLATGRHQRFRFGEEGMGIGRRAGKVGLGVLVVGHGINVDVSRINERATRVICDQYHALRVRDTRVFR